MKTSPLAVAPTHAGGTALPLARVSGLLPRPLHASDTAGTFELSSGSFITADPELEPAALYFARSVGSALGLNLAVVGPSAAAAVSERISVRFISDESVGSGYHLSVSRTGISVSVGALEGAFSAVATLQQLLGEQAFRAMGNASTSVTLAWVEVTDSPRFGWRGVLLDVARHFMPKANVLRFIDVAAQHKLNVLHLHLTDDQGWRVEIKAYPELTRTGAWRKQSNLGAWRHGLLDGTPHGGFYTQEDLREIVAYARARGITVMPEIDVPGHTQAAIAAYPQLSSALVDSQNPPTVRETWGISTNVLNPNFETLEFFKTVFSEVMDIFDGPYIGLGGDEVPPLLWRENPDIVEFAAAQGLASVDQLHGWFLGQLAEFVVAQGRRPVVWDEGVSPSLPRQAIVTTWRGYEAGAQAMAAGYDIVLAPEQNLYLDHRAADGDQEPIPVGFVRSLEDVLAFEPDNLPHFTANAHPQGDPEVTVTDAETLELVDNPSGKLLGIQAQLWTEQLNSPRRVDYAAFPRLSAFAEVAWSKQTDRTEGSAARTEFIERLVEHHLPRLAAAGVEYRPLSGPLPWQQRPGVPGWPLDLAETLKAAGNEGHVGGWREGMEI